MRVLLLDLPHKIKGFVTQEDGENIIVLNSRLNHEANQLTYLHELEHIDHNDLTNHCNVNALELLRHK